MTNREAPSRDSGTGGGNAERRSPGASLLTLRVAAVTITVLVAASVYPILHFYLVRTDAITEPSPLDDFSCLSCHGGTRGHIQPPDRSCVSCHLQDFRRDLVPGHAAVHVDRIDRGFWILGSSYALFVLGLVLFLWHPLSPGRILFAVLSSLLLLGVLASYLASARASSGAAVTAAASAPLPTPAGASSDRPPAGGPTTWPIEGVFRDGVLQVSPSGRFAIVSARRRDTNNDGTIDGRDFKSLLLVEDGRESVCLVDARLIYQDRMARWAADGRTVALVLPETAPAWTPWDAGAVVVLDPATGREVARWSNGANPFWLWDGRLAWERGNTIVIGDPRHPGEVLSIDAGLADLALPAQAGGAVPSPGPNMPHSDLVLRSAVSDPWNKRIVTSWSPRFDRDRPRHTVSRPDGILVELVPGPGGWKARRLEAAGHAPHPLPGGLFSWTFRGDENRSGSIEIALDGMNLDRDGKTLIEDAVFHGLFHGPGMTAALVRREGGFALWQTRPDGSLVALIAPKLHRHGGTWLSQFENRVVISAMPATDTVPAILLWHGEGRWQRLATGPVSSPQASRAGVAWITAAGEEPGTIRSIPWPR